MTHSFESLLPQLLHDYDRGILVPFLGAGMSAGSCPHWSELIDLLEAKFGKKKPKSPSMKTGQLIERANAIVATMARQQGAGELAELVRSVLYTDEGPTAQTRALAKTLWPLVLSTNYDDLFVEARAAAVKNAKVAVPKIVVLGRNSNDCRRILASLDGGDEPILWALHGYLSRDEKNEHLAKEVVLGHEEYRRIAHDSVRYRRAFAEVYRRRALFFLGSSLTDTYLLDLFSEVQELYGPSRHLHYALVQRGTTDVDFLRMRFNIIAIEYDDHAAVTSNLTRLAERISVKRPSLWDAKWHAPAKGPETTSTQDYEPFFAIEDSWISKRHAADFVVFSGGWATDGSVFLSKGPEAVAASLGLAEVKTSSASAHGNNLWVSATPNMAGGRVAVAVPWGPPSPADRIGARDLRLIRQCALEALQHASASGVKHVRMALLGAGSSRHFPGRSSLSTIARAYRELCVRGTGRDIPSLTVHVVDDDIVRELNAGHIDVPALLYVEDLTLWVEIDDARESDTAHVIREPLICAESDTVQEILQRLDLRAEERLLEVHPSPSLLQKGIVLDEVGLTKTLADCGVTPGATLRFKLSKSEGHDGPTTVTAGRGRAR